MLVVVPAYNEEESLGGVLGELCAVMPPTDIAVVNDGSTDRTAAVAEAHGVLVIDLAVNLGIGGAVQAGLKYGWQQGYDVCLQVDADSQHDPADIPALLEPIRRGQADCVIGSRFCGGAGGKTTVARRMGIHILSGLLRIMTGRRFLDVTSGYRAMNQRAFGMLARSYPVDYPEPESLLDLLLASRQVVEVPVTMRERQAGSSSIRIGHAVLYMVKVSLALLIARLRWWANPKQEDARHPNDT